MINTKLNKADSKIMSTLIIIMLNEMWINYVQIMYAQDWKGKWKLLDLYEVGTVGNLFLPKCEYQPSF